MLVLGGEVQEEIVDTKQQKILIEKEKDYLILKVLTPTLV